MPRRAQIIATGEIYHVYNRSVGHEEIFTDKRTLKRWFKIIDYYRFPQKLKFSRYQTLHQLLKDAYKVSYLKQPSFVEIYAFAFMPNHFHFLIKQLNETGIERYCTYIQNSLAKYFNLKNDRHGSLFDHTYKAKLIETDEEFLHVSRYIHLNPVTSYLIDVGLLTNDPRTSFPNYLKGNGIVNSNKILEMFPSKEKYIQFVSDHADYQRTLSNIKHLLMD